MTHSLSTQEVSRTVSPLCEAALELAEGGLRVFPLKPGEKRPPLIKKWPERASTNPSQIRRWWRRCPKANIGLVTGGGLIVVDVDPRSGGSLADLDALGLPPTLTATTPSGGFHWYYRTTEALRSSASAVSPGIDVKGERSFVVAAPSVAGGGVYAWEHIRPITFLDDVGVLRDHRDCAVQTAAGEWRAAPFEPREHVGVGGRHAELTRWAGHLRGQGCGFREIESYLHEVNATFDPPIDDREEIEGIVDWIAGKES